MQGVTSVVNRVTEPRSLAVSDLGVISYVECWELQRELGAALSDGLISDTLLLLEHQHTITCGRGGGRDHILSADAELRRRGVTLLDVDRGGDVTYHGPGQLVAYPILNLAQHPIGRDFHAYIRALEQVLIDTLAHFAIVSHRIEGLSGVWVTRVSVSKKIAAIGVKVDGRAVTSHGIALNVSTDLSFFELIVPCGIRDKGVTSMAAVLENRPSISDVKEIFARRFADHFGFQFSLVGTFTRQRRFDST